MQDRSFLASFPSTSTHRDGTFDLPSALDRYGTTCTRLVDTWFDMDLYADFRKQLEAIRQHAMTVPALTVYSLQLAIAHFELVSTLWQDASVGISAARLEEVKMRHAIAAEAMRAAAAAVH
jgi:hypothetical protein